jgi:predicted SAM-dependent methyltransferase
MKLHLGCGKIDIQGFINIDICKNDNVHIVHDVVSLPMFADNSVDLIYASALFQYFDFQKGQQCLKEWYRVLKPNGVLRVSTVDFDKLLEVYEKCDKDIDKVIGPMYGKIHVNGDSFDEGAIYHKTVYTKDKFICFLKEAGFSKIKNYDWKDTIHSNYDDQSQSYFPHMDKKNGIHIMQNWEATK